MAYEPTVERLVQMNPDGTIIRYIRGFITSNDEKPISGIADRSELYERDTGKWFLFNGKKKQWIVPDDIEGGGLTETDKTLSVSDMAADAKAVGDRLTIVENAQPAVIQEKVDEWLEDNIAQETGYALDSTLSMANAAAPADKVGELKTALIQEYTEKALLAPSNVYSYIVSTSNKWISGSSYGSYFIKRPDGAKSIKVKANENGTYVVQLKTREHASNTSVVYATGTDRRWVSSNSESTIDLVEDCKYINILYRANSLDYTPTNADFIFDGISETKQEEAVWIGSSCIVAASWTHQSHSYVEGQLSTEDSSLVASEFIPITEHENKLLELPLPYPDDSKSVWYGVCLYDENGNTLAGRSVCSFFGRTGDDRITIVRLYLPKNAKYFRTTYWSQDTIDTYNIPAFYYKYIDIPEEYKPITHELPVDTYMQNSIRRARQLTDIRWTPRVNIPRYSLLNGSNKHFLDWFYADHEYIGIPYSGAGDDETHWSTVKDWGYTHYWVGQHIPIESFVTAARYPNSIMGEKVNQSQPSYDSSPYGDVCTALVNYVVDGPTPLRGITNFFDTSDEIFRTNNTTIDNISDINAMCIGEFLYKSTHVIFISDIIRDENGNITQIEMSEATTVGNGNNSVLGTQYGGVARRKMWDINEFKSTYGGYKRYRRNTFYGIPYARSKYVNTGNEGDMTTLVDMPCIPYLGEGAVYKVSYIHNSKICIGATGFTSLVVTKDGEAFGTFDVTGLTEISTGFSEVGEYTAYLSDGTTQTKACHWTVEA